MLGMHGTYEANMAMHDSDCIIAVGARFDDRITGNLDKFCPYAKIIHFNHALWFNDTRLRLIRH
jgi:acetolactate synthase-1/2/3 large subunit